MFFITDDKKYTIKKLYYYSLSSFKTILVHDLQNTDTHPFIWSAGCDNGGFTGTTCLAESFLRAEKDGKPTGAIAVLMSSANQTWYPQWKHRMKSDLLLVGKGLRITPKPSEVFQ